MTWIRAWVKLAISGGSIAMEVCDLEIMDGPRPLSAKEIPGADVGAIMAVRQRLCGNYETAVCAYGATVISTPLRALALYEPAGWSGSKRLTACPLSYGRAGRNPQHRCARTMAYRRSLWW